MTWKTIEDFLVRNRIPLSLLIVILLLYEDWNEKLLPQNLLDLTNPLSVTALACILIGLFLRSWAAGVIRKTKQLATTGPYALTRHPLYVGSFFLGVGFSLIMWDNENLWVLIGLALVFYVPKIRQEEKHLAAQFPDDWKKYCARTARFFPKGLPDLHSSWSWRQWAYNREYNALLTSLILATILAVLSRFGDKTIS